MATGPGPTSANNSTVGLGQSSSYPLNLDSNATEISVSAETNSAVPIRLVVLDPTGLTVQVVDAVNGVAVVNTPINRSGLYTVKVINVGLGPVQVWSLATPTVRR